MVGNLKQHFQQIQPPDCETYLESLLYTMGQRRTLFPWVAAHPVPSTQGLEDIPVPRIGMVFTGQGA